MSAQDKAANDIPLIIVERKSNNLFDESPLEDLMWHQLKKLEIKAERQWEFPSKKKRYFLDFAIFCQQSFIDVEADGDTWHARADRIPSDNERNNQLAQKGWRILRYNGKQIRATTDSCIKEVQETINDLGGLSDEGLVPRIFYQQGNQPIQQLSMFEPRAPYHLDSGAAENLEMQIIPPYPHLLHTPGRLFHNLSTPPRL